jgi:glycosyltransferase involved in cell wall biosynthesis
MKISVIIAMYNAEKYLAVCLKSILIQTLTDFEVIVVDDCSTDNSLAIAENYLERFGGRLKILMLEKNTGSGAVPRNIGLEHARGKYIFFMDNDDLLIDNAFEELFKCAEDYQADVILTDTGFKCDEKIVPENLEYVTYVSKEFLSEEPIFETDNIATRMEKFFNNEIRWSPWLKFSSRDFLTENKINFLETKISEDGIWTCKILCLAKKILHVSAPFYVQRFNKNSITRSNRTLEDWVILHTNSLIKNINALDEFMNQHDFFTKNPAIKLRIIDYFISVHLGQISLVGNKLSSNELYEIFLRELEGNPSPALTSYLLLIAKSYRDELRK